MKTKFLLSLLSSAIVVPVWARTYIDISGSDWRVFLDKEASWQSDKLFLPGDYATLSELPLNPPTMGWSSFDGNGMAVSVPGTLEEYFTQSSQPDPSDQSGVSWWVRDFKLPLLAKGERVILHFGSVRHRAEIFVDSQLVGYDMVAETPFDVDITEAVKAGGIHRLAVRITHPGGNFHWQDFTPMEWGEYRLLPSRGFGGILAPVLLEIVPEVNISDIYMQNQPDPHKVKAFVTVANNGAFKKKEELLIRIYPKGRPREIVSEKKVKLVSLSSGENIVEVSFDCPGADLWNIDSPRLYTCEVVISGSHDSKSQDFGFRWFGVEGRGEDAYLSLNGKRIMLRTAINWGFWPVTGLYPSGDMATRQAEVAKSLGLNMVNFHRSMSSERALSAADSIGLLAYEEPGGFHSADNDPFMRKMAKIKLDRMVRRDRSHPSLVIYNLINEWGGTRAADTALTMKRFDDMRTAHAIDPSRVMTFTSGWAGKKDVDEFAKANMLPFDTTLYLNGWYDNHRAGGPATWEEGYYVSPSSNIMYTDNIREIYMRGEEGAISTPPRIAAIHEEIVRTGKTGWDGLFWEKQYEQWDRFFNHKALAAYFGDIDSLTRTLGDIQFDHQGRRIQGMRMQDIGDVYAVNGWESMPYDNHSGIVDDYRNAKGNTETLYRYTRPAYIAVCPRRQFVNPGDSLPMDIFAVNEVDVNGICALELRVMSPSGVISDSIDMNVDILGGKTFGQLLKENLDMRVGEEEGMYRIEARLTDSERNVVMDGYDEVLALNDKYENLDLGKGAFYGREDSPVREFYQRITGKELPIYDDTPDRLDWIIISRSMLDDPQPIPQDAVSPEGFTTTYFRYHDIADPATTVTEPIVNHTFVDGEQPHSSLSANQSFSVIWNGDIVAPADGVFMLGVKSNQGIRFKVNGVAITDDWGNKKELAEARPFTLTKGEKVNVEVQYRQTDPSGYVQLVWTLPGQSEVSPENILNKAYDAGTRIVILDNADTWMETVCKAVGKDYDGFYTVGRNWVGGVHFVKDNPYFDCMPVNTGMGWPYQAIVRDGDRRLGFELEDENMLAGSYRSWPFHLGSALGEYSYGNGKIIYNTFDLETNLLNPSAPASVARRLFLNLLTK